MLVLVFISYQIETYNSLMQKTITFSGNIDVLQIESIFQYPAT